MITKSLKKLLEEKCFWDCECIHENCYNKDITLEHAYLYAGKKIEEIWNYVPCCRRHNVAVPLPKEIKNYNKAFAMFQLGILKNMMSYKSVVSFGNLLKRKDTYRKFNYRAEYLKSKRLIDYKNITKIWFLKDEEIFCSHFGC